MTMLTAKQLACIRKVLAAHFYPTKVGPLTADEELAAMDTVEAIVAQINLEIESAIH